MCGAGAGEWVRMDKYEQQAVKAGIIPKDVEVYILLGASCDAIEIDSDKPFTLHVNHAGWEFIFGDDPIYYSKMLPDGRLDTGWWLLQESKLPVGKLADGTYIIRLSHRMFHPRCMKILDILMLTFPPFIVKH